MASHIFSPSSRQPAERFRLLQRAAIAAVLVLASLTGCIKTPVKPTVSAIPEETKPYDDRGQYGQRASDAPKELEEFGRFTGRWECRVQERTKDLLWQPRSGSVIWTWFYTLGGHAVQDIWEPRKEAGTPAGTNLRIYDSENGAWKSVWTASDRPRFEYWQGAAAGGDIVMQTRRDTARAKITFYEVTDNTFEWRYERVVDREWQPILKTSCTRLGRQL